MLALSHANPDILLPTAPDSGMVQQVVAGDNTSVWRAGLTACCVALPGARQGPPRHRVTRRHCIRCPEALSDISSSLRRRLRGVSHARAPTCARRSAWFSFALSLVHGPVLAPSFAAAVFTARRCSRSATSPRHACSGEGNRQSSCHCLKVEDELGFLVNSFNAMTRRIAHARNALEEGRHKLQAQHNYLETVLGGLSTGVMALDGDGRIQTANPPPSRFSASLSPISQGRGCRSSAPGVVAAVVDRVMESFEKAFTRGAPRSAVPWCRSPGCSCAGTLHVETDPGTATRTRAGVRRRHRAAQGPARCRLGRGGAARRARDQNPLTPIQLSMPSACNANTWASCRWKTACSTATHTIVQQVEAMKTMVNDFSDYAKPEQAASKAIAGRRVPWRGRGPLRRWYAARGNGSGTRPA